MSSPSSSSSPAAAPAVAKDSGYTAGEDAGTRWRNFFSVLTGQMTPEGKQQYKADRDIRYEASDCARCEKHRDYLLQYSPIVRFLTSSLQPLAPSPTSAPLTSSNIRCVRCPTLQSGGFSPTHGIRLCANHLRSQSHVEDTLSHELIHAYDHLRFNVDWSGQGERALRHAACTEIRASSLSGECRFMREFWTRGQWRVTEQHQACVKRRAALSLMGREGCKDEGEAKRVVSEVWEGCWRDTRPFDEIYR